MIDGAPDSFLSGYRFGYRSGPARAQPDEEIITSCTKHRHFAGCSLWGRTLRFNAAAGPGVSGLIGRDHQSREMLAEFCAWQGLATPMPPKAAALASKSGVFDRRIGALPRRYVAGEI
jgi:hypothetical protein